MTLRERLHHSIDSLDNISLAQVYDKIESLLREKRPRKSAGSVPTLEEVLEKTGSAPGNWSDDVIADREDRV